MVDGALERRNAGALNAFGFSKKYSKSMKCEPKNLSSTDFLEKSPLEKSPLVRGRSRKSSVLAAVWEISALVAGDLATRGEISQGNQLIENEIPQKFSRLRRPRNPTVSPSRENETLKKNRACGGPKIQRFHPLWRTKYPKNFRACGGPKSRHSLYVGINCMSELRYVGIYFISALALCRPP